MLNPFGIAVTSGELLLHTMLVHRMKGSFETYFELSASYNK